MSRLPKPSFSVQQQQPSSQGSLVQAHCQNLEGIQQKNSSKPLWGRRKQPTQAVAKPPVQSTPIPRRKLVQAESVSSTSSRDSGYIRDTFLNLRRPATITQQSEFDFQPSSQYPQRTLESLASRRDPPSNPSRLFRQSSSSSSNYSVDKIHVQDLSNSFQNRISPAAMLHGGSHFLHRASHSESPRYFVQESPQDWSRIGRQSSGDRHQTPPSEHLYQVQHATTRQMEKSGRDYAHPHPQQKGISVAPISKDLHPPPKRIKKSLKISRKAVILDPMLPEF